MSDVATQPQVTAQTDHVSQTQNTFKQPLSPRRETRQVLFYPDPLLRSPSRLPDLKENRRDLLDLDTDINTDFEEILHTRKVSFQKHMKDQTSPILKGHQN